MKCANETVTIELKNGTILPNPEQAYPSGIMSNWGRKGS